VAGPEISGVAVGMILAGGILTTSALTDASVADTLRNVMRGQAPPPGPGAFGSILGQLTAETIVAGQAGPGVGPATGRDVAATAVGYIGVPYVWAGETPDGWDCSGFVTWVLHTEHGLQLPDNHHTTAIRFYTWTGATNIARSACAAGDLVCWPTHIGIATGPTEMVHAPGFGQRTRMGKITAGAVIRRPLAYT
jgi:cell wall-associated NlpC family hydrolase